MTEPILAAPAFRRFDEYLGCWAYEPERFLAQWQMIRGVDMTRHMAAPQPDRPAGYATLPARGGKSIAVLKATGTLMKQASSFGGTSTIQLRRDVRQAAADPNVSAILLAIDSPGGTTAGTADLAADVRAARKAKPVWAHIDDLGASAAYWVASQADMIFANTSTALVGSIGTLLTVYDMSASAEREGIKTLVFKTGPLKGAGVPGSVITDEQRAHFQKIVDDGQSAFDAAVRSGRGMTAAELAAVRTGGVFGAAEALSLKLIDGVRSLDKTIEALANAK
ncbi:peptidase s49 : Periplasmic serine proteases (ClpP class) OS=Chthonomonas calidirosea (strain DSM 23976 / ICMP 18418 / T49) GN=CCALI_01405 PE=4 SV=1: Peptidase_S49 [Gemmataceae bacterium]|nr:peptidase s49 : Periplasmic serine proteases (ClpP class) OS=Chthonomonas calidirosea (strain DSM 23976 / ICMP 18418 / T49) GN=CCALI_01405 PE=4 SV=1: Peptidase_S49 [Gemmataceae bacterium]VTU01007.1 peptidase s49 : Periplasmic serine proteases (ClpP class) OS=Chthonomonas calidirosea (strain DSM 23976 / ICMP 18418 / T49) GN=CCALI_01405 PE=4 SV=1: Peptidase_S49 [Gemmataceae bacterium]